VAPTIQDAQVTPEGKVALTVKNPDPGTFAGEIAVRVIYADGSSVDLPTTYAGTLADGSVITVTPPARTAIGTVRWQLVRSIPASLMTSSGELSDDPPLVIAGNSVALQPQSGMAAVLTRTSLTLVREH
jgi:hypothetical protein